MSFGQTEIFGIMIFCVIPIVLLVAFIVDKIQGKNKKSPTKAPAKKPPAKKPPAKKKK